MDHVLTDAQPIYIVLDKLKEHLVHFQKQVLLEDSLISFMKTNLLAEFWTILGSNQQEMQDLNKQLVLLKNLRIHGGKVSAPDIATRKSIPVVVHYLEEVRQHLQEILGSK